MLAAWVPAYRCFPCPGSSLLACTMPWTRGSIANYALFCMDSYLLLALHARQRSRCQVHPIVMRPIVVHPNLLLCCLPEQT
eukprot:scaffold96798_cov18-Tisochrysis_lutea.AAC.1